MKIVLIRHGMTPNNERKEYTGRRDVPLSSAGREMLEEYRKTRNYPKPDLIYTSTLIRTSQSCEILFPGQPYRQIHDLRETDFGDFEGLNYEELKTDPRYNAWMASGGYEPFPNGEGVVETRDRCCRAFAGVMDSPEVKLLEKEYTAGANIDKANAAKANTGKINAANADSGEPVIAFVVHGGTIMALLSGLGTDDKEYFEYYTRNGEGYIADYTEGKLSNCRRLFD